MSIKNWLVKTITKSKTIGRVVNVKLQELINTDSNITSWRRGYTQNYTSNEYQTYP